MTSRGRRPVAFGKAARRMVNHARVRTAFAARYRTVPGTSAVGWTPAPRAAPRATPRTALSAAGSSAGIAYAATTAGPVALAVRWVREPRLTRWRATSRTLALGHDRRMTGGAPLAAASRSGAAGGEAHSGDAQDRLGRDRERHLRPPRPALAEDDRHLLDSQARTRGSIRRLDLERVAVGREGVEIERAQRRGPEALEPAGQVADRRAQHGTRVDAARSRQEPPVPWPAVDPSPAHVAGPEHDVGARPRGGEQARKVGGVVGEVGVHLEDVVRRGGEREPEARDVRAGEASLRRPVQDMDAPVRRGERVGDVPRSVRGAVVDDQDRAVHARIA